MYQSCLQLDLSTVTRQLFLKTYSPHPLVGMYMMKLLMVLLQVCSNGSGQLNN